jgi:hypothetical protein
MANPLIGRQGLGDLWGKERQFLAIPAPSCPTFSQVRGHFTAIVKADLQAGG